MFKGRDFTLKRLDILLRVFEKELGTLKKTEEQDLKEEGIYFFTFI